MTNKDVAVQEPVRIIEDSITLNPLDLNKATTWEDFISLWTISQEIDVRNQWFKGILLIEWQSFTVKEV